jgi:hypothetical protein
MIGPDIEITSTSPLMMVPYRTGTGFKREPVTCSVNGPENVYRPAQPIAAFQVGNVSIYLIRMPSCRALSAWACLGEYPPKLNISDFSR